MNCSARELKNHVVTLKMSEKNYSINIQAIYWECVIELSKFVIELSKCAFELCVYCIVIFPPFDLSVLSVRLFCSQRV